MHNGRDPRPQIGARRPAAGRSASAQRRPRTTVVRQLGGNCHATAPTHLYCWAGPPGTEPERPPPPSLHSDTRPTGQAATSHSRGQHNERSGQVRLLFGRASRCAARCNEAAGRSLPALRGGFVPRAATSTRRRRVDRTRERSSRKAQGPARWRPARPGLAGGRGKDRKEGRAQGPGTSTHSDGSGLP